MNKLKTSIKTIFITILILISCNIVYSQTGARSEGATRQLTKWEIKFGEVNHKGNIYKKGSNWLSFGLGGVYRIEKNTIDQSFGVAYHLRYKAVYFNGGWHFTTNKLIGFRPLRILRQMEFLNDIHLGAGIRTEGRWHNISFFIGPSWALMLIPVEGKKGISKVRNNLGAILETQIIYKYFYDIGVGVSIYGSFNKRYQVAGLKLCFYFSNAYIGKY